MTLTDHEHAAISVVERLCDLRQWASEASEPNGEMARAIRDALWRGDDECHEWHDLDITRSVEAAIEVLSSRFPCHPWDMGRDGMGWYWARIKQEQSRVRARAPALALLAATLDAIAQEQRDAIRRARSVAP